MSLGLEFLSRADVDVAAGYLQTLPVKHIFQTGFSLPRKLQARLESLEHRPTLSIVEGSRYSLLNADERALADSLSRPRPTFAWDSTRYETFKTQDQLDSAAFRIGMLAFKQLWLFVVAHQTLETLAEAIYSDDTANEAVAVTLDTLFATWVANYLLGGEASLRPLRPGGIMRLGKVLREAPWDNGEGGYFKALLDRVNQSVPVASNRLFARWLNQTLERLGEEIAQLKTVDEVGYFQELLLVAS